MLHDILKLDGVAELNKSQQNLINGQVGCCLECVRDSDCNDPEQICEFARCVYFM
ncbi:hypothetical protein [Aquimarina celericrescens]|uniref:Uncharacterized protein n=1 Tax=Aquimarina celericrescens TaxID=1964542 RepID=A0ABW5B3V4_9FLAO|nr:hypothetical protein [Aquimarina celericrescens]